MGRGGGRLASEGEELVCELGTALLVVSGKMQVVVVQSTTGM